MSLPVATKLHTQSILSTPPLSLFCFWSSRASTPPPIALLRYLYPVFQPQALYRGVAIYFLSSVHPAAICYLAFQVNRLFPISFTACFCLSSTVVLAPPDHCFSPKVSCRAAGCHGETIPWSTSLHVGGKKKSTPLIAGASSRFLSLVLWSPDSCKVTTEAYRPSLPFDSDVDCLILHNTACDLRHN